MQERRRFRPITTSAAKGVGVQSCCTCAEGRQMLRHPDCRRTAGWTGYGRPGSRSFRSKVVTTRSVHELAKEKIATLPINDRLNLKQSKLFVITNSIVTAKTSSMSYKVHQPGLRHEKGFHYCAVSDLYRHSRQTRQSTFSCSALVLLMKRSSSSLKWEKTRRKACGAVSTV